MKKIGLALAAMLSAGGASAADLGGLAAWAGKYPFDAIGGRTFWTYPGLQAELRKTMGEGAYAAFARIQGPNVPVVRSGDFVAAHKCQQHDCGDKNATAIARLSKGDVVVCIFEAPARPTPRWHIPGRAPADDRGQTGCPSGAGEIAAAAARLGF